MAIFITGGTGFLGSYAVAELIERTDEPLFLMTRLANKDQGPAKLWRSMQVHWDLPTFKKNLRRLKLMPGNLHAEGLGLSTRDRNRVVREADSVLHIAASLNRKSAKACLNSNLRGTLSVIQLAQQMATKGKLRRYTHVSTVAISGHRKDEIVYEDQALDWDKSDYDPYGRTKKFCEHMATQLLPDVSKVFLRPSIVMGDSKKPATTQFDMVRAFCGLADMPVVPLRRDHRFDIVPADYVGEAIAHLHLAKKVHERYHLSSGAASPTGEQIGAALASVGKNLRFVPAMAAPFDLTVRALNRLPRSNPLQPAGALLKVFWPYLVWNTVFDNTRVTEALGRPPTPFPEYAQGLYRFATQNKFAYPYMELPSVGS